MKKRLAYPRPALSARSIAVYLLLTAAMALLNFALPRRDPLSFSLFFAALACNLNPFLLGAGYLIASAVALSVGATLVAVIQTSFFLLVFSLYRILHRTMKWERVFYCFIALVPFIFLYPHAGYGIFPFNAVLQKTVISGFFFLLSFLFEGGLHALLHRALRCRLSAGALAEISLLWLFAGMGVVGAFGPLPFYGASLFALLLAVLLLKNAASVPFAAVLSLPLCVMTRSALPIAEFSVYACLALLLCPYGKIASSLTVFLAYAGVQYLGGVFSADAFTILFTLLACALPVAVVFCIPERVLRKLKRTLLFYRERTLPRIAINRNRRAVGEQLYEVSSLFREIETAFDFKDPPDRAGAQLCDKLVAALCTGCGNRRKCEMARMRESMEKLIAVGRCKGRVNLIDLPAELSAQCVNSAGMLFALNKHLADYRRYMSEIEAAREGRRLLAEQAHGVSDILRDIALEQSEEYVFSDEEQTLATALAQAGILSSEIFLYGEGSRLTASMTLESGVDGKRLAAIASRALKTPLSLSEKIPLTLDRACYILKRKAKFDAAFGIASRPKEGETANGDTHSILKIDERRFLVALSDGMGSGENARTVSDHTLSLLESFYKTGMPSQTVLGTVNRLIAFSAEETFSCLDLAAVNLDTGTADIVKIGSPLGFLLSGKELRVLEGDSLPIGMLEAVHPATMRLTMKANDFLIFMSDGVTSAFGSSADLCAYLSALRPLNPQSLAEEILAKALNIYEGKAEDDMTVLAVKLTDAA